MSRIKKINFTSYKNIKEATEIEFPLMEQCSDIVIFIGKNGVGKSSILHAIYGCCSNSVVSDFWFDSAIDTSSGKPEYWYEYEKNDTFEKYGKHPQVRLARIFKKVKDTKKTLPDYWESARPSPTIQMSWKKKECKAILGSQRWPKFDLKPKYVDFRHNITAFDSAIYGASQFGGIKDNDEAKQRIAKNSKFLKKGSEGLTRYKVRRTHKYIDLESKQIAKINEILEKDYIEIRLIYHNYYEAKYISGINKVTIIVKDKNLTYSDAYAGTGESAIIQLIYQLTALDEPTVIILDEPESSLHVSAQKKLMRFLCEFSKKEKHQIFISTHSPFLIEDEKISKELIFVCEKDPVLKDKIVIKNIENKNVAFNCVGNEIYRGTIYTEDILTKTVVDFFLNNLGLTSDNYRVSYLNGFNDFGKNILFYKDINAICIADKDQYKDILSNGHNLESLNKHFLALTGCSYPANLHGKSEVEQTGLLSTAIDAFKQKVKFFDYWDIESFIVSLLSENDRENTTPLISGKSALRNYLIKKCGNNYDLNDQQSVTKQILIKADKEKHPNFNQFKDFISSSIAELS